MAKAEQTYRGYLASEKPRCPHCQGFLSFEDAEKKRIVCPNCSKGILNWQG